MPLHSNFRVHVESPNELPFTDPFVVEGWVTSEERINAVSIGNDAPEWLTLCDRPDVRLCFPQSPHVVGFRGHASARALEANALAVTAHLGSGQVRHLQPLEEVQLPPAHLQTRQVGGDWGKAFYGSGVQMFEQIESALKAAGASLAQAERVLDFGCGCGRVLRNFKRVPHTGEIWGCDIDAQAIGWNRGNLAAIAKFDCNGFQPPLAFPDHFFEVIYSVSVFTHLPEDMQFAWLNELRRVLKPNGLLLASLHGEDYWSKDPGVKQEVESHGFAYRSGQKTEGLPEFYMTAFHSEAYVRREWARYFEPVEVRKSYLHGVHDLSVMRARSN